MSYSDKEISRIVKTDVDAQAVRKALKTDPVIKRIRKHYVKAIRNRVHQIERRVAAKRAAMERRVYLENIARVGVRLMPTETNWFGTRKKNYETTETAGQGDLACGDHNGERVQEAGRHGVSQQTGGTPGGEGSEAEGAGSGVQGTPTNL